MFEWRHTWRSPAFCGGFSLLGMLLGRREGAPRPSLSLLLPAFLCRCCCCCGAQAMQAHSPSSSAAAASVLLLYLKPTPHHPRAPPPGGSAPRTCFLPGCAGCRGGMCTKRTCLLWQFALGHPHRQWMGHPPPLGTHHRACALGLPFEVLSSGRHASELSSNLSRRLFWRVFSGALAHRPHVFPHACMLACVSVFECEALE